MTRERAQKLSKVTIFYAYKRGALINNVCIAQRLSLIDIEHEKRYLVKFPVGPFLENQKEIHLNIVLRKHGNFGE